MAIRMPFPPASHLHYPQAIFEADPQLAAHKDHLLYRWHRYNELLSAITQSEGSLEEFALGYKRLGIHRANGVTTYREWAPAAQAACLIGDFSEWQERAWMQRDQWGVWGVTLPDNADGSAAVPHGSRVKVRMQHPHGHWVDRLPAYIPYATIPPNVMGAKFDGVHWDPPQPYRMKHARPARPESLRIYESHVGMSGENGDVATYAHFRDNILPRIKKAGYNCIQIMAVQEHAYYASFGYHVTNPFAVSSRCGDPEDLKSLVDEAHRLGIVVLLDAVHSHISSNADDGLAGLDMGQREEDNYFLQGEAGYHSQWDSRVLNYRSWETLRLLLSNLRWWVDEFGFDGFRFDGVTSMLYQHHGINMGFSGNYQEYFGLSTNVDACVYLMLANELTHRLIPNAVTVAEDVSGMPTLCRPVSEGGVGFDYRLGMAIPDKWIKLLKHTPDEEWGMLDLVSTLCNRRYTERTVAYSESHDQALVGDQTIAFRLMGAEMYSGMSGLTEPSAVIERGRCLHMMIRMVTMGLGGEAYLTFMGNEFGHPEWIDFPREGNDWSGHYARRQWKLQDEEHLRYRHFAAWDRAMMELDDRFGIVSSSHQWVTHMDEEGQMLVFERGPLLFVMNWSPSQDHVSYKVATPVPGKWRVCLDSDAWDFGGRGRVAHEADHFSQPSKEKFHDRDQYIQVMAPSRTCVVYYNEDTHPKAEWKQVSYDLHASNGGGASNASNGGAANAGSPDSGYEQVSSFFG